MINDVQLRLSEGVDPSWVPVGTFTEVNASVFGTRGTDLTNLSEYRWEVSSGLVSWIPQAPNVFHLYTEWYCQLWINVTATWEGRSVTTSVFLNVVRAVEDVRLEMDPPVWSVCSGDTIKFTIELLDWRGVPIEEGGEFCWSVDSGTLVPGPDRHRAGWTVDGTGHRSIVVEYTYGPMRGSASYSLEVQRRLSSVAVWPIPSEADLGTQHYLPVWVLDEEGVDVTPLTDVSIDVTEGCATALRWSWDPDTGYLHVIANRPGPVTFDVVADLNGSTVRVTYTLMVNGSLDEPFLEHKENMSDLWMGLVLAASITSLVMLGPVVEWLRGRTLDKDGDTDEDMDGNMDEGTIDDDGDAVEDDVQ